MPSPRQTANSAAFATGLALRFSFMRLLGRHSENPTEWSMVTPAIVFLRFAGRRGGGEDRGGDNRWSLHVVKSAASVPACHTQARCITACVDDGGLMKRQGGVETQSTRRGE